MSLKKVDNNFWTMGNGVKIKISEMNTSHIKNCINKIKKSTTGWRSEYLESLEEELKNRNLDPDHVIESSDSIKPEEKLYFLETSCGLSGIKFCKDDFDSINYDQKTIDFVVDNIFIVSPENIANFKIEFLSDLKKHESTIFLFYQKYNPYLLDNVFTKSWSPFIDLMLGRKKKVYDKKDNKSNTRNK